MNKEIWVGFMQADERDRITRKQKGQRIDTNLNELIEGLAELAGEWLFTDQRRFREFLARGAHLGNGPRIEDRRSQLYELARINRLAGLAVGRTTNWTNYTNEE